MTNDHQPPPLNPIRRFGDVYYCEFDDMNDETLKLDIIKTGGPAYPWVQTDNYGNPIADHSGMTLRDRFALAAPKPENPMALEAFVAYSYRYADAMLAERVK